MIDHNLTDRMISRSRTLGTSLERLQELAPRLRGLLPISIGEAAERLGATRQEIEDTAEYDLDHVARRERLVRRNADLRRADDDFYVAGGIHVR